MEILEFYKMILNNFNKQIQVELGQKFSCYPLLDTPKITIPLKENKNGKQAFDNKIKNKFKRNNIDIILSHELISFLHELGHIETYTIINDIRYRIGKKLIQKLQELLPNEKYLNFFYNCYFNLKLEKLADKWLINYVKNNLHQVQQWDSILQKIM